MKMINISPNFSFILPAYKAKYLKLAIQSIINQTYNNFELIIIDDDSPENLSQIVDLFNDSRITYIKNDINIGGTDLVKQWNHCIQYANNDYTILAADDDLYSPFFLEEILKLINKYPELSIYRGRNQKINEINEVLKPEIRLPEILTLNEFLLCELKLIRCIGNIVFKTNSLKQVGFINYPLAWQSDIATLIVLIDSKIAITPKTVYSFRVSTINISNTTNKDVALKKLLANFEYFKFLEDKFSFYKNSSDPIEREIYNLYLNESHLRFVSNLNIIRDLSIWGLIHILKNIKHKISHREYFKFIYYYFFRSRI